MCRWLTTDSIFPVRFSWNARCFLSIRGCSWQAYPRATKSCIQVLSWFVLFAFRHNAVDFIITALGKSKSTTSTVEDKFIDSILLNMNKGGLGSKAESNLNSSNNGLKGKQLQLKQIQPTLSDEHLIISYITSRSELELIATRYVLFATVK
jgi:hypothetical protein